MLIEGLDAASGAFEVGYESPSQFNREYKRFFGQSPYAISKRVDSRSPQCFEAEVRHGGPSVWRTRQRLPLDFGTTRYK